MTREIGVVTPFWLDRPDEEAVEVAVAAERDGIEIMWVGEMVSFDASRRARPLANRDRR